MSVCVSVLLTLHFTMTGGPVVKWLALPTHRPESASQVEPFCVDSACLPVPARVLSRFPGILPQSKHMFVRVTGDSKLAIDVNVSISMCWQRDRLTLWHRVYL